VRVDTRDTCVDPDYWGIVKAVSPSGRPHRRPSARRRTPTSNRASTSSSGPAREIHRQAKARRDRRRPSTPIFHLILTRSRSRRAHSGDHTCWAAAPDPPAGTGHTAHPGLHIARRRRRRSHHHDSALAKGLHRCPRPCRSRSRRAPATSSCMRIGHTPAAIVAAGGGRSLCVQVATRTVSFQ